MNLTSYYQSQWLRLLLAFIFGASGTLAFSPFDLWPAALLSILFLQLLTLQRSPKQAFSIAFAWGFGLFGSGVNWCMSALLTLVECQRLLMSYW